MIGNQNPRWMGLDAGRLGMAIAACALAGACFGGGGIDYETLAQENRSAAPYSFQYLGVAGTREDAVKLAEDMVDPEALEALADFDPETQVLVAFRVGTSGERGGEVGYIDSIRVGDERMEVRINWTDDGVDDDDDEDTAPYHLVAVERSDVPREDPHGWVALDSGQIIADGRAPLGASETGQPVCVQNVPEGYEDLIRRCAQ
jgi:hypothetical protein